MIAKYSAHFFYYVIVNYLEMCLNYSIENLITLLFVSTQYLLKIKILDVYKIIIAYA